MEYIDKTTLDLPPEFTEKFDPVLEANPHLVLRFYSTLGIAVGNSFKHPDTKLRGDIKKSEIDLRIKMCLQAVLMMYFDQDITLIRIMDILPDVLIDALREGMAIDQKEVEGPKDRWAAAAPPEEVVVDNTDLNEEPVVDSGLVGDEDRE